MVSRSRRQWQTSAHKSDWHADLRTGIRDLPRLCQLLDLDPALIAEGKAAAASYPLSAPRAWLDLIEPGNPDDPLLRQILPTLAETRPHPDFGPDPVGDQNARQTSGLLCKYPGRALLLVTGACPIHCRYCFRRCFPFAASMNHPDQATRALAAIAARPDLSEVILSGGDPLLLNDRSLGWLLGALESIGHLKRIRLHTRIPTTLPSRIDATLCRLLGGGRLPCVLVTQTNHPRELGEAAATALARLQRAGITLLNQSVLLRGVNDSPEILRDLSERLFALGVMPYYLHLLDQVTGSAHFALPLTSCVKIAKELRAQMSGYLMPRVVIEQLGANSKTPLDQAQEESREQGDGPNARKRVAHSRARV
ncbi:EF-P beta-lysylation protein EpmB [Thiorhodovibrio winogradskyi]|nr:EF-P beta-lysylation protein EpmB [Thiorhodovibrio winogradskyi]